MAAGSIKHNLMHDVQNMQTAVSRLNLNGCMCSRNNADQGVGKIIILKCFFKRYRAFHNVLRDYKNLL
jgi:hypothetical protein